VTTAAEFLTFLKQTEIEDRDFELDRGKIVERPLSGIQHGFVCANVASLLGKYAFRQKIGYACSNNPGFLVERNPDTVFGPDLVFVEGRPTFDREEEFGDKPPLLAVEVLSPDDNVGQTDRRIEILLQFGVPIVWVVDPKSLTVAEYRPGQAHRVIEATGEIQGGSVLPEFRCDVAEFFEMPGR
jgi:Uma2 family endonuclease